MKPSPCLIRRTASSYVISYSTEPSLTLEAESTSAEDLALAVLDLLQGARKQAGDGRNFIVYCPDPRSTLFTTGLLGTESKPGERRQLKYLAESLLPLDAEQMAADFIVHNGEFRVLAVAHDSIVPIVEAFHQKGMHFRWIAPASLLAVQEAADALALNEGVIVWEEPEHCDIWWLDDHGPKRWNHITGDAATRAISIRLFAAQVPESTAWTLLNSTPELRDAVASLSSLTPRFVQIESQEEWSNKGAMRLCRGVNTAWFDLRDGVAAGADRWRALYGWMAIASVAFITAMCALPIACWWKSQRLVSRIEEMEQAEQDLFRKAFPDQLLPDDVAGVLTMKHIEARGARDGGGQIEPTISAISVMHAALTALAEQQDFLVERFNIDNGELTTDIRLKTFEEVPPLTSRLQSLGIQVQTPTSQRNGDGTVTASFRGTMKRIKSPAKPIEVEQVGSLAEEAELKSLMEIQSRPIVYLGMLLLAALVFGNVWALQDFWSNRVRYTDSLARLADCRQKIADIRRLENQPRMASLTEESADDIVQRVNSACDLVGVALQSVTPGALVPEGNSSYSRRNTSIILGSATLSQLIQFAEKVEDFNAGLAIRDLSLTTIPGMNTGPEVWNVNLTLTQLVFSPKS